MPDYQNELDSLLKERGASIVGYADLRNHPDPVPDAMPYAISIAAALDPFIVHGIITGPTLEYQGEYNRVNTLLNGLAAFAASFLKEKGFSAHELSATISNKDDSWKKTLSMPLPHKTVATRAGIGWVGKDALIVTKQYGSAIRFASVLADAPFVTGVPVNDSLCGSCSACVDICPAGAPLGTTWHAGMQRSELYDVKACFYETQRMNGERGLSSYICGMCIAACPWTRKYIERHTGR